MQSNLSRKNNDINSEIRAFAIFLDEIYRIADEKRHNENEVVFVCITRKCYDMLDIALHKFPEYFTENVKSVKRYSDRQILFNRSLVDNAMICMIDDSINFGGAIKTLYKKLGFLNTNQKNIIVATYLLSESLQGEYVKEYFEENKIEFCYGRKINNDELARFICDEIKFIHENKGAYTIDLPMYDTQNISDFDITKLVENYSNIVVNYDLSILGKEKINNVLFEVCSYSIMKKLGKLIMGMFIKVEERRIDNAFVFTPYVLLNNIDVKYLKKIIEHFFADMTNYSYYFSTEEENDDNCLLMYKVLVFLLSYQIGEIFFSQCKDFFGTNMHMINDNKISFDKEIVDYIKKINFEEKIKTLVLDEYSITNENVSPINLVKEKYCLQICDEILNKLQFLKARVVKNTIESLKELDIKKQDKFTSEQLEVYDKIIWMYQNSKFISIDELKKLVDEFDFNLNPYEINYILSRFILYANDISFASKKIRLVDDEIIRGIGLGELSNIVAGKYGELFHVAFSSLYRYVEYDDELYEEEYPRYVKVLYGYFSTNGYFEYPDFSKRFIYYTNFYNSVNIDLKTEFENREYLEDDISKTELIKRYLDSIVQLQVKERTQILY